MAAVVGFSNLNIMSQEQAVCEEKECIAEITFADVKFSVTKKGETKTIYFDNDGTTPLLQIDYAYGKIRIVLANNDAKTIIVENGENVRVHEIEATATSDRDETGV